MTPSWLPSSVSNAARDVSVAWAKEGAAAPRPRAAPIIPAATIRHDGRRRAPCGASSWPSMNIRTASLTVRRSCRQRSAKADFASCDNRISIVSLFLDILVEGIGKLPANRALLISEWDRFANSRQAAAPALKFRAHPNAERPRAVDHDIGPLEALAAFLEPGDLGALVERVLDE